ncbi:MAG: Ig-like domain-containing protein [Flavobacteriaceae bacterium]|nr:Ig-like domain-containing protein [Flavobacteriaceae bacterium]
MLIFNCANRGNPSGGPRDTTPPVITRSSPDNFTTGFTSDEITVYFDEYIKIKDLRKNLIISPPMDPEPLITPLGSASKRITIKILDTLRENTTYAFNFGESIVDNNEENPFPFYKYVLSTGDYIDSLQVRGSIADALEKSAEEFVSVMLYEVDSSYTDSIVYKEKPDYITNTLDSTSTFSLENLKAGTYRLIALKDGNNNFTFEQKVDKIGYVEEMISVPTTDSFNIELFKESTDFKAFKPRLAGHQKIAFGYDGSAEEMKIKLLSPVPDDFKSLITKDPKSDTLYYWFNPKLEIDSLLFEVKGPKTIDTFDVRFKDQLKDSLVVKQYRRNPVTFSDPFELEGNLPLSGVDENFIRLINKDSMEVDFRASIDSLNNRIRFDFEKKESENYNFRLLPGALSDLFGNSNDTLNYSIKTKALSDYGNLRLILRNGKFPLIVQLLDTADLVVVEKYVQDSEPVDFTNLNPGRYFIRVIYDSNQNGKYDPGSFLRKEKPERVSYFPEVIEVRASWNFIEEFTLQD